MIILEFKVTEQKLERINIKNIIAQSKNQIYAGFQLDSVWSQQDPITAQFKNKDTVVDVLVKEGQCLIPWETIQERGVLSVCLIGGDLLTTNTVDVNVLDTGVIGGLMPTVASPTVYSYVVDLAKEIEEDWQSCKSLINNYKEDIENYKAIVDETVNTVNSKLKETRELLDALDEEIGKAEEYDGYIQESIDEAIALIDEIRNLVTEQGNRDTKLLNTIAVADEKISQLNSVITKADNSNDSLTASISVAENRNKELTETIFEANSTIDELNSAIETGDLDNKADNELIYAILNKKPTVKTLDNFFEVQRTELIYQTKIWNSAYNPSPICEKMGANTGLVCEPSTDTVEGRDDYADKIEFMWWRCNYVYDEYGNKIVTAIEGDENYSETGNVDVGTLGMTFYYNFDNSNENYKMLNWSTSPNEDLGLQPFDYSVMHDGTIRPYYVLSAYPSVLGDDGLLHSQPNKKIERFQTHNNVITNYAKKGANVTGARASRNTFQMIFQLLKYGTKDSQSIFKGVTSWNFQYEAAVERATEDTYFPVTAIQATNLEVGCCVSVGYASNNDGTLNKDRGQSTMHSYADDVKITAITEMDDGNYAVYLDTENGFTTLPVALTDELSSPVMISTMPIHTGDTDNVIGKHDGSNVSNSSGNHSYRIQGVEYSLGTSVVASDVVVILNDDNSKSVYVAPRGVEHTSNVDTIKSTYKCIGTIPTNSDGTDTNYYVGDVYIDNETGGWYPSAAIDGSTQGWCDYIWAYAQNTINQREYLMGGALWDKSSSGSAAVYCNRALAGAFWSCCSCD